MADTAKTPTTPATAAPANDPKVNPKRGTTGNETFPSAEEAINVAKGRVKGARRAFKVTTPNGKEVYYVSHNVHHVGGVAFLALGGKIEELGRAPRVAKPLGVDGVMAAVNALPETERKAVLEQLKLLSSAKK